MRMKKDIPQLLEQYKPLILSIYRKYHPMLSSAEDKEDLLAEIEILFSKLVMEYNPRYGVDFPYYIKRMLTLRTWHYVGKQIKTKSKEIAVEGLTNDEITFSKDFESNDELDLLLNVLAFDDDFKIGKKQKALFVGLLKDHKTLQQLADEEGVNVSTLHTRLHFLIKKLKAQQEEQEKLENDDLVEWLGGTTIIKSTLM